MKSPALHTSLAVVTLCLALPALASNPIEKQLESDYAGKTLTLRRCYEGDHLHFGSDGKLLGNAPEGPWTLDGRIDVKEVRLKGHALEIKGRRVHVVFDSADKAAKPVDWIETLNRLSDSERKKIEKAVGKLAVVVEIEIPSNGSEQDISSAMHAVFLMPGESMMSVVPDYWQKYIAGLEGHPELAHLPDVPKYQMARRGATQGSVLPPRAIGHRDPEYSDEARRIRFQGTEVLWLVVGTDGSSQNIHIERPLGMGLDEEAIKAVRGWKFDPAMKDGEPIAVQINVEISFRLY
jgi:TonB family protein